LRRLSYYVVAFAFAAAFSQLAVALAQGQGATTPPPGDFGSPPSGQIPILFNDRHVYAKPDTLKQGRVLAALVRSGTVLIPLRSMFEQMGATVSYDASSKTVDVSKAGSDVKVTVGQPEVMINGASRPLDVPPIMYQGHVLVPIRVISEGMGAYVQWVPDKQTVVVRYIVPTPPPSPTPTARPPAETAAPPPPPPLAPAATPFFRAYVAGDYLSPKVYNEFSSGQGTSNQDGFSYAIHGNAQFSLAHIPLTLGGSYNQINYAHTCGINASGNFAANCYVTTIGGIGSTAVPAFTVRNYLADAHLGFNFFLPRLYIDISYLWIGNNAGYPWIKGQGSALDLLPDLDHPFSVYGSYGYYGNVSGTTAASFTGGVPIKFAYIITRYDLGATYSFTNVPLFIEAGYKGDAWHERYNAPGSVTQGGPYVGLGLHF
jgi:hypothetical protein